MLDDRKKAILRAVVETYIETAEPVGSSLAGEAADLGVSSATIRNELSQLDQQGYLTQPHTSAGRIPTDKAYRAFVDDLDRSQLELGWQTNKMMTVAGELPAAELAWPTIRKETKDDTIKQAASRKPHLLSKHC